MSEQAVANLAAELNVSLEHANVIWLKARKAMFKTLSDGHAVDLGFAYLQQTVKTGKRRFDFTLRENVVVPDQISLKMLVPPHIRCVLNGTHALDPHVWLTRAQVKRLKPATREELKRKGCDYYQLKGVSA